MDNKEGASKMFLAKLLTLFHTAFLQARKESTVSMKLLLDTS